jgi:hypothetical protein
VDINKIILFFNKKIQCTWPYRKFIELKEFKIRETLLVATSTHFPYAYLKFSRVVLDILYIINGTQTIINIDYDHSFLDYSH